MNYSSDRANLFWGFHMRLYSVNPEKIKIFFHFGPTTDNLSVPLSSAEDTLKKNIFTFSAVVGISENILVFADPIDQSFAQSLKEIQICLKMMGEWKQFVSNEFCLMADAPPKKDQNYQKPQTSKYLNYVLDKESLRKFKYYLISAPQLSL